MFYSKYFIFYSTFKVSEFCLLVTYTNWWSRATGTMHHKRGGIKQQKHVLSVLEKCLLGHAPSETAWSPCCFFLVSDGGCQSCVPWPAATALQCLPLSSHGILLMCLWVLRWHLPFCISLSFFYKIPVISAWGPTLQQDDLILITLVTTLFLNKIIFGRPGRISKYLLWQTQFNP